VTHDELREEYSAFALGVADETARIEIAEHLARKCDECTTAVREALATVAVMSGAVASAEPPSRLRRRVLDMVRKEPKRSWALGLIPWATAGILAVVLASVTLTGRATRRDRESLAKLQQALQVLNDPAAKDVSFGDPKATGRVLVSPSRGIVLIAAHLPKLDRDRIFQMWVIPTQGNPIPAGTFASDTNDTAVYVHTGAVTGAAAIAVTVEPAGGSPQPTTTPFIVTNL
jgi:anti-sigma-K factor RskA